MTADIKKPYKAFPEAFLYTSKMFSAAVPHPRVPYDVGPEPSMTRQEFAAECDVNALMARYDKTGVWPLKPIETAPQYLDLTDVPSFQDAMHLLIEAERAFMSLPATVRRDFDNDPAQFVAFAEDASNIEKMREWGLAPPAPLPEPPMRVEVTNPPPPPDKASALKPPPYSDV